MTEEKKYYLTGTDEEVMIGDVIEVPMTKKFKDGQKIKRVMECKLTEETIPYALDMGLIIEAEPEDNEEEGDEGLLDFDDTECPYKELIGGLVEDYEQLEGRVEKLEEEIKELQDKLVTKKETASSKKK